MKNMSPIRFNELFSLYVVIFLGFFGYALTIALFIPMLMDRSFDILPLTASTSLRATMSGCLLAMYPLGQFLGSPVIGKLSDHYGRKKVLVLSLMACLFGFMGIALSIQYHQLSFLFVSCLLTGVCESNMAISQSVIADNCHDPVQKTKLIGYAYSACSLGYIMGPLVGGFGATIWGYSSAFWMTAVGVLFLMVWILSSFKEQNSPHKEAPIKFIEAVTAIKTIFNKPKLYRIYFVNFLIFFSVMGIYRVVPLYVVDEWNPALHVYTFLISFVSLLCFMANLFVMARLANIFSTKKLLSGLLLLGGIVTLVIVIPVHFSWIWLTFGLAVIPTAMALTVCTTWLSDRVESKEQGQALGNNQALLVLGESSSAAIGGLIAAVLIPLPVVVMGVILLVASFMVWKTKQ